MERVGFWSRMSQWFRSVRNPDDGMDEQNMDGHTIDDASGHIVENGPSPGSISRFRGGRSGGLERLEQEYTRVVNVIESVQKNLELQCERSEQMAEALTRLNECMAQFPEFSRTQIDLLTKINERASADAAATKNIEQTLGQMPRLADAQREALVGIGRQLDASRESSERVVSSLDGFKEGLNQVAEVAGATGRALEKSRWDSSARDERLATILQEQTKKLTLFAIAAISLAAVAALASVIAMFVSG